MLSWRNTVSAILLSVFVWYILPKEIVHVFVKHQDTIHIYADGLHFEGEHHHCLLSKVDQHFNALIVTFAVFQVSKKVHPLPSQVLLPREVYDVFFFYPDISLRGPPTC